MKQNNNKTILFKQREKNHISKYNFKANENGKIDFKVIPYPKYKKTLKNKCKFKNLSFKNFSIILLIMLIIFIYIFTTNKHLTYLIDKKESNSISIDNIVSNNRFHFDIFKKSYKSYFIINDTEYIKKIGYLV